MPGPALPPQQTPGSVPSEHLVHSANKYLLGANYVPGPVLGTGIQVLNKVSPGRAARYRLLIFTYVSP